MADHVLLMRKVKQTVLVTFAVIGIYTIFAKHTLDCNPEVLLRELCSKRIYLSYEYR